IYAHELLTFNDTVSCEVISKWKAALKEDMDAQSDVCKAEIWASKGLLDKAKGNVLDIEIIRDQSSNTLRVSQSRDCDLEKNVNWSCIYAFGSQEYLMVCTRLDISSADVGLKEGNMAKGTSGYELSLVAGIATGALVKGGSHSEVPA
ncbi:hypothetical protein Tco_0050516, partial [Tanacetum coccineum]